MSWLLACAYFPPARANGIRLPPRTSARGLVGGFADVAADVAADVSADFAVDLEAAMERVPLASMNIVGDESRAPDWSIRDGPSSHRCSRNPQYLIPSVS